MLNLQVFAEIQDDLRPVATAEYKLVLVTKVLSLPWTHYLMAGYESYLLLGLETQYSFLLSRVTERGSCVGKYIVGFSPTN